MLATDQTTLHLDDVPLPVSEYVNAAPSAFSMTVRCYVTVMKMNDSWTVEWLQS